MKTTITKLMAIITVTAITTQLHANIFKAAGNLVGDTGLAAGNAVKTTFTGERIENGDRGPFADDRYYQMQQEDMTEAQQEDMTKAQQGTRRYIKPYRAPIKPTSQDMSRRF